MEMNGVQKPIYIGGRRLSLSRNLSVQVPEGWHRADKGDEKREEAYLFMYTGKNFDPEKNIPFGYLRINFETNGFATQKERAAFEKNVENRLVNSGWSKGELSINRKNVLCLMTEDESGTTYLAMIPFGLNSISTYTMIPKKGAGFPKFSIRFLQSIEWKV